MAHRADGDGAPPAHNAKFKIKYYRRENVDSFASGLRKFTKNATRQNWNGERKCETLDLQLDKVADTRASASALTGLVLKYIEIFSLRGELGCTHNFKYKLRFQRGAQFVHKQPKYKT